MTHERIPLVDLVLRGGRITTFDAETGSGPQAQSVAIAGGRVIAVGTDAELAPLAELAEEVVELEGRRVLPGLNDSHIHAIRAGASWTRSLHWEGMRTLDDALESIAQEAARRPKGEWIPVIGGWHSSQLDARRAPTRAELDAVAPEHPVYVQELYDRGILNTAGLAACGFTDAAPGPKRGTLMRDTRGALTGEIRGGGAFAIPTALALTGTEDAVEGTRRMCAELARLGLTGIVDAGGLLMTPRDYDAVHEVHRAGELDVRMRMFVSAWTRGGEIADMNALTSLVPPESGDAMLRFSGIGEIPHLGCHDMEGLDDFVMTDQAQQELVEIVRMCAQRSWRMSIHAVRDSSLSRILDAWETVEQETGLVAGRGWSIVHADEASPRSLERIARLGAGIMVQSRLVLKGGDYVDAWGAEPTASAPPIADMRALGIPIGAGTDATRANWFSPWACIWWLVTGGTLDGRGVRDERHRLSRVEALAAYTRDAAWFTGETGHRGRIAPGYDADLFVATQDPLSCGDDDLLDISSVLTIMNGRVTYDAGLLAGAAGGDSERNTP